ncbi:AsmA family protein [Dysgonomonas macrotermitis]|uniref:AsmA family protein n=1 Tax=Dysgonomonas macrotermitis TaxID=1346286 RepID=A0A1M5BHB0_9BACT|nr:AsmA family protein [Dysgonomonas macrotermitis]SHF41861.1 AsmA family protein [Dysgonomonas macrotermitis]
MKKSIKRGLIIGGSVFVAFLIALLIVPFLFEGKIRESVIETANRKLNAELHIENLGISLFSNFPNITLSLEDVVLSGINDFEGDTLIKAKAVDVVFSAKGLLKGNYTVSGIRVDKGEVYALSLEDGRNNWDIIKTDTVVDSVPVEDVTSSHKGGFNLELRKVSFSECKLVYEDRARNLNISFTGCDGNMSGEVSNPATELKSKVNINEIFFTKHGISYLSDIKGYAETSVSIDTEKKVLTILENYIRLNDLEVSIGGTVSLRENNAAELDLRLETLKSDTPFKNLLSVIPSFYSNGFNEIATEGKASIQASVNGLLQNGHHPAFDFRVLIEDAMFRYPSLPSSVDDINLVADIRSNGDSSNNTIIDISKLEFSMGGKPFSVVLNIDNTDFIAKSKGVINLADIRDVYPLDKDIQLRGKLTVDLSAMDKKLDQSLSAQGFVKADSISYKKKESHEILINGAELRLLPQPKSIIKGNLYLKSDRFNISNASGSLYINTDFSTDRLISDDISQVLSSLNATGFVQSDEIKVHDVEFLDDLSRALKTNLLKSPSVKDLNIRFSVKEGKILTKPFVINLNQIGSLSLQEGSVNLEGNRSINYKGTLSLPQSHINNVSLTVKGTLDNPQISVDTKSIIGNIANGLFNSSKKK